MAFRELSVTEVSEVLRQWQRGLGYRTVADLAGVDKKTVRRYVETALKLGLSRDGGVGQLTDEVLGQVAGAVRSGRDVAGGEHADDWLESAPERSRVAPGQALLGLKSSGFHSNGYSLVRLLIAPHETELLTAALTPTRLYVKLICSIMDRHPGLITGLAHITGGGFHNITYAPACRMRMMVSGSRSIARRSEAAAPSGSLRSWEEVGGTGEGEGAERREPPVRSHSPKPALPRRRVRATSRE